jgi:ABC-type lipoprotein release transport system permease subunit
MSLRMLLRLSVRNLLRHRRRNGLLLASVIVAVISVTFLNALMRGIQVDLLATARQNLNGDWLVVARGYHDEPALTLNFSLDKSQAVSIAQHADWISTSRLRAPVVLMSERETRGVQLVGIDPAEETFSFLQEVLFEGEAVESLDTSGVVLGRALAEDLRTRIGKRVVVVLRDGHGKSRETGHRVIGLFDAEGPNLEKRFAFIGRRALQSMAGISGVTEISFVAPEDSVRQDPAWLQQTFMDLDVRIWRELEPQTAALVDMLDSFMYVWFAIIMAALAFGLVNGLVTAIMERRREFGLMRCLGMTRGLVLLQVMIECGLLMGAGVVIGLAAGYALITWSGGSIDLGAYARGLDVVGFSSRISLIVEGRDVLQVAVFSMVFGALASLLPAVRANRLSLLKAVAR